MSGQGLERTGGTVTATSPRPGRPGTRLPLRITLVALMVALVAVALTATGFAATRMLNGYLEGQQAAELRQLMSDAEANREVLAACVDGVDQATPNSYYVGCVGPDSDEPVVIYVFPPKADDLPDVDKVLDATEHKQSDSSVTITGEVDRVVSSFSKMPPRKHAHHPIFLVRRHPPEHYFGRRGWQAPL